MRLGVAFTLDVLPPLSPYMASNRSSSSMSSKNCGKCQQWARHAAVRNAAWRCSTAQPHIIVVTRWQHIIIAAERAHAAGITHSPNETPLKLRVHNTTPSNTANAERTQEHTRRGSQHLNCRLEGVQQQYKYIDVFLINRVRTTSSSAHASSHEAGPIYFLCDRSSFNSSA